VKQWRGGVFASLCDNPPDLDESFARGSDRIENWPMASLMVGYSWNKTIQCNWKVFWENFNECLHCPNIHPELCDLVPMYRRRISYFRDAHDWRDYRDNQDPLYTGGLRAGAASWSNSGQASGAAFEGLSDEEIARGQSYFVSLPSVFIAAHVDYMRTVRVLPLGPEQTEIEAEWLFPQETLGREDFDLTDITDFGILVMQQDAKASELNQQGLHTHNFEHGVLMPEEHHVRSFQDWVREQTSE
jgi:Rieske 2Fe-2S family protein